MSYCCDFLFKLNNICSAFMLRFKLFENHILTAKGIENVRVRVCSVVL